MQAVHSLFGCTNVVNDCYTLVVVLTEIFDKAAASACYIQPHKLGVVLILAERFKNLRAVFTDSLGNAVKILFGNIRISEANILFNDGIINLNAQLVHSCIFSGGNAPVYTKLFCVALAFYRLLVIDIHNVHCAVSNICKHIHARHFVKPVDYGGVALGIYRTAHNSDMVQLISVNKIHVIVSGNIASEMVFTQVRGRPAAM